MSRPGRPSLLPYALTLILLSLSPGVAAAPRIQVDEPLVHLGELTRFDEAVGRFEIRNVGDAPLVIRDALPSCGCTVVSFDGEIAPGATGSIEASLDITTVRGTVWYQIHVYSNDPQRPEILLDIRARVVGGVRVLPGEDVFLHNRIGRLPSARVLVRKEGTEEAELDISGIEPSVDWLRASAERVEEKRPEGGGLPEAEAGDWVLAVHVAGPPPYGNRVEESVAFETGLPSEPFVRIPVLAQLEPPVSLSRETISLTSRRPRQTIVVTMRSGADPDWLRVESRPDSLATELEELDGRHFKLHVRGEPGLESAEPEVLLHVGQETIRIPVEWETIGSR